MSDELGKILKNTLTVIESGKEEIFVIAEISRTETQRLTKELIELKSEVAEIIVQVDLQQKMDRRLRQKLMEVSGAYQKYSEKEMFTAYAEAKDSQVNLQLLQAKEIHLRKRRDDLERALRQMDSTIQRAEKLMTQVGMAISILQGGIIDSPQMLNYEQRLEMGLSIIRAQEEERQRVAREIHDGPAQTLANIVLRLEITEKLMEIDQAKAIAEIKDLKNLVRSNLQDIRRIIFDLRPMALDDLGIVPAISKYLNNFEENYGIKCELIMKGRESRLIPTMEVALFRLIQEGMTNVAKHAQTAKVEVTLTYQEEWTIAHIRDFGKGFDVESIKKLKGAHFGLIGMRERVEMFSGHFSIVSSIGIGTTIEFSIPSKQQDTKEVRQQDD